MVLSSDTHNFVHVIIQSRKETIPRLLIILSLCFLPLSFTLFSDSLTPHHRPFLISSFSPAFSFLATCATFLHVRVQVDWLRGSRINNTLMDSNCVTAATLAKVRNKLEENE
jgi:hypothetical protein